MGKDTRKSHIKDLREKINASPSEQKRVHDTLKENSKRWERLIKVYTDIQPKHEVFKEAVIAVLRKEKDVSELENLIEVTYDPAQQSELNMRFETLYEDYAAQNIGFHNIYKPYMEKLETYKKDAEDYNIYANANRWAPKLHYLHTFKEIQDEFDSTQ